MKVSRLIRLFLSVILLSVSFALFAQDQHFVYIQTENNQPFYVRLNGKVFSSTSGGYVILSRLDSGDYRLFAGFPKNEFPEQEFQLKIDRSNEGFLLKKLGNGWSLFNIETMALTEGVSSKPVQPQKKNTPVQQDRFATLLADAVRDSSILESGITTVLNEGKTITDDTSKAEAAVISPLPVDSVKPSVATVITAPSDSAKFVGLTREELPRDSASVISTNSINDSLQSTNAIAETPLQNLQPAMQDSVKASVSPQSPDTLSTTLVNPKKSKGTIRRILLVNEAGGLDLVYVDPSLSDTIRIFLPVSANTNVPNQSAKIIYNPPVVSDTAGLTITPTVIPRDSIPIPDRPVKQQEIEERKEAEKPLEKKIQNVPESVDTVVSHIAKDTVAVVKKTEAKNVPHVIYSTATLNSDCKNFATERDFLKLRKRMAAETDNDKMIEAAKKYFKNKCFSTEQIQNLSYLFLDDEGKYKFFDAAYPFTADTYNYSSLESQLKDPYYINRFRAMIHK